MKVVFVWLLRQKSKHIDQNSFLVDLKNLDLFARSEPLVSRSHPTF